MLVSTVVDSERLAHTPLGYQNASNRKDVKTKPTTIATAYAYRGSKHGTSEPHGISLHGVADHVHIHRRWGRVPHQVTQTGNVGRHTRVHVLLDVSLQALAEVLEHGGAAGEHDVLVQPAAHVDGALHDGVVHHVGQRSREVGAEDFGVEEHLGPEEALVSDVTGVRQTGGTLEITGTHFVRFNRIGENSCVAQHHVPHH